MAKTLDVMILNLPSPPHIDVCRDWAGGFGTAMSVRGRADYGQSSKALFQPFLAYTSAVLSNGNYDYSILDCQRLKLNKPNLLKEVNRQNPNIIISLIGLPSLRKDLELLDELKKSLPYTTIVGVGTSCRFVQNDILLKSKIDAVLRNSYPYVSNLTHFLNALEPKQNLKKVPGISYIKSGKVVNTREAPDTSLDKLPPPNYNSLQLDGYDSFQDLEGNRYSYISIIGSKGCPYPCIYCPYPLGFGKKWTHRSSKSIVDEIEHLHTRGVEAVLFRDQSFLMDKKHATNICEEIRRRELDIAWFCEARVDHVSREILRMMKKAGCKQIHYGAETGDSELFKQAKPWTNLDAVKRAFRLTKEAEIWGTAHVILGWPDEDLETLAKTFKFVTEIAPHSVNWNFLTPYPGTEICEMAREGNLILPYDWSKYTSHTIVMRTKWLDESQLRMATNKIISDYSRRKTKKLLLSVRKKYRFILDGLKKRV